MGVMPPGVICFPVLDIGGRLGWVRLVGMRLRIGNSVLMFGGLFALSPYSPPRIENVSLLSVQGFVPLGRWPGLHSRGIATGTPFCLVPHILCKAGRNVVALFMRGRSPGVPTTVGLPGETL